MSGAKSPRKAPAPAAALWRCPTCRRGFAKAKQWHSCAVKALDEHFRGRDPDLRGIFDELVRRLRKLGPVKVDPVRTSINLTARHHFGAVTVRGNFLRLGFLSDRRIEDRRIVHIERLGPWKFGHSVVLESVADLDDAVMNWLAAAYRFRSETNRPRRARRVIGPRATRPAPSGARAVIRPT